MRDCLPVSPERFRFLLMFSPIHPLLGACRRWLFAFAGASTAAGLSATPEPGEGFVVPALELPMIWVEPGSFVMGSPPDEPRRDKSEGPQTHVTLTRGFWLGKTEVTQAAYEAIAGSNPSRFHEAGPNAPVERVSWNEAIDFCEKLTKRERAAGRLPTGYAYTLPTEAQWEFAYRAGSTAAYPTPPDQSAWHDANSGGTTRPVAQLQPNAWGFHDLGGNVLEWCLDWYGPYPGGKTVDFAGPSRGHFRMARGGSWRTGADILRSAARAGGSPDRQDYTLGFRIALAPEPKR